MKRLWLLFVMLFLAACGGGGGTTASGGKATASSAEGTVVVDFNKVTSKTVAAALILPDPAYVRVVFRNYQGTDATVTNPTATENVANKQIFDVKMGSSFSYKIPVVAGSTIWTVDAIYYSKDGGLNRMQYYGKSAPFTVNPTDTTTITVSMAAITTPISIAPLPAGSQATVSAPAAGDNFYGKLLAQNWNLVVKPTPITTPLHLATVPQATNTISAADFVIGSKMYAQAEFYIIDALKKETESASAWTYNCNADVTVTGVNNLQDGDGHGLFRDNFPPDMKMFAVPTYSTSATLGGITAQATDNIGVTDYCIKAVVSETVFSNVPNAPELVAGDVWQSASQPLAITLPSIAHGSNNYVYLYIWARDLAGNVTTMSKTANVDVSQMITINDSPQVLKFAVPYYVHAPLSKISTTTTTITGITLTGSSTATTFAITQTPADTGTFASPAPTSFVYVGALPNTDNIITLYGWVKDGNGTKRSAMTSLSITSRPASIFSLTEANTQIVGNTVHITGIKGTTYNGNNAVEYLVTETPQIPATAVWTAITDAERTGAGASKTFDLTGATNGAYAPKSVYVWVRDSDKLVSTPNSKSLLAKF